MKSFTRVDKIGLTIVSLLIGMIIGCSVWGAHASPQGLMRGHTLRYAPSTSTVVDYPSGSDNGETLWIDSSDGPQTLLYTPLSASTASSPVSQIAATTGKRVHLLGFLISASVAGTVKFQDEAGTPNALTGAIPIAANTPLFVPVSKYAVFDSLPGAAIDIAETGSSGTCGGYAVYCVH
jgi:hypothetical protein